jgi:DNA-binding PadR family transcriptional regulator
MILGLLSEAPLSGYQIKKIVDVRFRFFWSESFGQIFPALKSLASDGLIEEMPADGTQKRRQKTYGITPDGTEALKHWLMQPVEKETYRLEILLKLYFSNYTAPDVMLNHMQAFQAAHAQQLYILDQFQKEVEGIIDRDENHREVLRVIDCGQKINRAYLAWSRETIAYLERKKDHETENS